MQVAVKNARKESDQEERSVRMFPGLEVMTSKPGNISGKYKNKDQRFGYLSQLVGTKFH